MSKIQTIKESWSEIIDRLRSDKQELAQFLRFSAGMYKQSFSDAVLIYQQNPYATKVATLETWNRLGRLVNKGEHSIAVFGEDSKPKHLFDITQTNGKRIPDLWKLTEDLAADLTAVINKKYGRDCKNIQEVIAAMSVDNTRPHLTEMMYATQQMKLSDSELKTYQQSFVSAVRFMVSNRCELDGDMKISGGINLNVVDLFKDTRDLVRFCDLVQKSAKDTLLEMEREIVQILKKRRELNNDLQTERNRADVGRGAVHGEPRGAEAARTADRQVGKDVAGMNTHGVSDRSPSADNRGQVADNSEGDRHRSGEPLSGAGRAVQAAEPAPDDVRGNSPVGENAAADLGTSGNGRSGVPSEITVESLIERYNKADFNRRWDSYETAGWILSDAQAADFRLDAVEQFDKYHTDKFSVAQAEEIRGLIRTALENREKTHDFIDVSVDTEPQKPVESEPIIINNSFVITSDITPLTDEKIIVEILKSDRFFKVKREQIAEFFAENLSANDRAEFMKKVFNDDYTEFDISTGRGGYKRGDNGVVVWEGHYLNRYKESGLSWDLVQSFTAKMIEQGEYLDKRRPQIVTDAQELIDGDTVRIDGEEWKVLSAGDYLISLKNSEGEQRNIYNAIDKKWYDLMNEHGFEFISSSDDDHIFYEPEEEKEVEPIDDEPEQLTLFGDYEPIDEPKTEPKKSTIRRTVAYSNTAPNDEMIDYILKCGGNDDHTLERIVAQFQKGKSDAENADFLRKEFCSNYDEDGRGYKYVSGDFTSSALLAAWFDKDGITAAINNTAFPRGEKIHLLWEQVSEKISSLLERGEYCEQDIIDRAAENEMTDVAAKLWYIHQDFSEEYRDKEIIPYTGIFPDDVANIKALLADKTALQSCIDGMEKFLKDYEENREILRFGFHRPKELLSRLKDLQIPRKEFITKSEFKFEPKFFISEDEKDWIVAGGGNVQGSKFRIAKYFSEGHSAKEKADFLKHEYGEGG